MTSSPLPPSPEEEKKAVAVADCTEIVPVAEAPIEAPPWERLPHETDAAWRAFSIYRDLPRPKRSFNAVAVALFGENGSGKIEKDPSGAPPHVYRWAKQYQWAERIAAYDREMDKAAFLLKVQAKGEAFDEIQKLGMDIMKMAQKAVAAMMPTDQVWKNEDGIVLPLHPYFAINARAVASLAKVGADLVKMANESALADLKEAIKEAEKAEHLELFDWLLGTLQRYIKEGAGQHVAKQLLEMLKDK